jgi:ABC-type multidrug transport system ATPase subunit
MEEADVLCNRIAIVEQGILRCVGPQVRLKTLYGGGYHLFINCHKLRFRKMMKKVNERQKRKKLDEKKKQR